MFNPARPATPVIPQFELSLRILEEKGLLQHAEENGSYVFSPVVARDQAGRSALRHLLDTFFEGSAQRMMATLLDSESARLDPTALKQLERLVADARKGEKNE